MPRRAVLGALLRVGCRGGPGARGLHGNLPRDPGARGVQGNPGARGLVAAGKVAAGLATAGVLVGNYMEGNITLLGADKDSQGNDREQGRARRVAGLWDGLARTETKQSSSSRETHQPSSYKASGNDNTISISSEGKTKEQEKSRGRRVAGLWDDLARLGCNSETEVTSAESSKGQIAAQQDQSALHVVSTSDSIQSDKKGLSKELKSEQETMENPIMTNYWEGEHMKNSNEKEELLEQSTTATKNEAADLETLIAKSNTQEKFSLSRIIWVLLRLSQLLLSFLLPASLILLRWM